MNNFDLMTKAQTLSDTRSAFSLAKDLVRLRDSLPSVKADAVRDATNEILGHPPLSNEYDQFIDYANRLERGEL